VDLKAAEQEAEDAVLKHGKTVLVVAAGTLIVLALLALGSMVYGVWFQKPATPAQVAPSILRSEPTTAQTVKVVTFRKAKTNKHLALSEAVVADDTKQVVAASEVKAADGVRSVSAVLDTTTGSTALYVSDPVRPWAAFAASGSVGAYVGYSSRGEPTVRIDARQDIFRVGSVKLGAVVTLDLAASGVRGFAGVGARYEW
jgi:hypothetical protein